MLPTPTRPLCPPAVALLLLAGLLLGAAPPARAYDLTLTTGPAGETYDSLGRALGKLVTEKGQIINLAVISSPGSLGNIRRLMSDKADFGLIQEDILLQASRGEGSFPRPISSIRAVGRLYEEVLHVLAREDAKVTGLVDLVGRRVALGAPGSGTRATAERVLLAHGIAPSSLEAVDLGPREAAVALAAGEIDALFLVGATPSPIVRQVLEEGGAHLVPLDMDVVYALEDAGWLRERTIYPDDYDALEGDAEITSAAVDAVLCCREDEPADVVYEVISLFARNLSEMREACLALEDWSADEAQDVPLPLHRGAVRFYYERNVVEVPVKVYTGLFLHDIFNFDLKTQSFDVDVGVWFRWRGRLEDEEDDLDFRFIEGEMHEKELVNQEHFGGWTYVYYEARATLRGRFLLHKYPFDTQAIHVQIQHERLDADKLIFVADENLDGTKRDLLQSLAKPTVKDWEISEVSHDVELYSYPVDFGSLLAVKKARPWSRYRFTIQLKRDLLPYLLKFALPLVLVAVMVYSSFFIHPEAYETKILVVIWVLFTAVEFHVYQSESLPEVGYLVTADRFFLLTYLSIFFTLIHVLVTDAFYHRENMKAVKRLRNFALAVFPVIFFGPIFYLIWSSLERYPQ